MAYEIRGWSPGPPHEDLTAHLPTPTIQLLNQLAQEYRTTPSLIIMDALATYLPHLHQRKAHAQD